MALRFYNTLSRTVEPFQALQSPVARMYTCGPTVYNFAHIGNFRAYVFEDLLRRYLKYSGFEVVQVMNLTDVDDKTIRGAREAGTNLSAYTEQFKQAFFDDIKLLGIEAAEHYPAATDHVPEMIDLISTLIDKGFAYSSSDGSVYYSIARFPSYGKLAHLDMDGLRPGARVSQDEYQKDNVGDFALWKAWDEEDGDVGWDSPWGRGRPGWHIECSAMSMKYLGESFDIHTGGIDNIFPHHEDEIAQSEAATGEPYARFWLHCAHLVVEGRKMAKSLGNFYTLRDITERGYTGREIRYVLLTTHYRQSLNFSFQALDAAHASLARIDEFVDRLTDAAGGASPTLLPEWATEEQRHFSEGLDDDLNISAGMSAVFDLIHKGNREMDAANLALGQAAAILELLNEIDHVLGLLFVPQKEAGADVLELVERRQKAREKKDWQESDRLRDAILEAGWVVQDTPQGPKLKPGK